VKFFTRYAILGSAGAGDNRSFVTLKNDRDLFLVRSLRSFQENVRRAGPAAGASYTLIGAILLLGGLGYAIDAWRGTSPWFLMGGLLLGIIVGFYELAMTVFRR
jgi:F0F1-type ATP synthase assembly protein I